jgi:hypothetical protein
MQMAICLFKSLDGYLVEGSVKIIQHLNVSIHLIRVLYRQEVTQLVAVLHILHQSRPEEY